MLIAFNSKWIFQSTPATKKLFAKDSVTDSTTDSVKKTARSSAKDTLTNTASDRITDSLTVSVSNFAAQAWTLKRMRPNTFKSPGTGQRGFTLIEIAIVLVVVALILTGMLKGQSLIDSARVRSMATEVSGIRAAWYSFQDRYRSLPGDFPNARSQIDNATIPGNGNGKIDDSSERAGVWQQLAMAGLINGNFDGHQSSAGTAQDVNCAASTCPRNPFNGFYKISYGSQAQNASGPANEIFTGDGIPVYILAQLDNKLDDGRADSGSFRVHRDYSNSCVSNGQWDIGRGHANCAAVLRE